MSIVVPVFNAERTVGQTVGAVLSLDYPADRFEAIFIDNGSSDRSREVLRNFHDRIVVLTEQKRGAGPARNTGIRYARHEYIAFTDADCVPAPNWLGRLVLCARQNPSADFVGGRLVPHNPASRIEKFPPLLDQETAIRTYKPPYALTGNLLMPRPSLLRIGLFDESFPRGQDVDLSYRGFFKHGAQFVYAEDAVVGHVNPNSFLRLFSKGIQHGHGVASILAKYSRELGVTPLDRLMDPSQYRRILRDLFQALRRGPGRSSNKDGSKDQEVVNSFSSAVFNSGKQLGLGLHMVKVLLKT